MADIVNTGTAPNDGTGDDLRTAFTLVNERLQQLLGTLSQITWAPGLVIEATPARQWAVVDGLAYVAASNHTAGATFADDLADGKWLAADVATAISSVQSIRDELNLFAGSLSASTGAALVGSSDGRSVELRLQSLAYEVDAAGEAASSVAAHNANPAAHPELTASIAAAVGQAEAARDAAIIGAGVYPDEATGRAAVADGEAFKVQGSGDVAAFEYRRTNSTTSVLIASYPSIAAVARTLVGGGKNKFNPAEVLVGYEIHITLGITVRADSVVSGLIYCEGQASISVSGMQTNTGQFRRFAFYAADGATQVLNSNFALNANAATIAVPAGAVWFRFCPKQRIADAADYGALMCEWGAQYSAYEAYTDPKVVMVGGQRLNVPAFKVETFGKKNQFNPSTVSEGFEIHGTTGVTAQADSSVSSLIHVDGWSHVTLSGLQTQAVLGRYYEFMAEDRTTLVLRSQLATGATGGTIAVPSGAVWFRFCPKQRNTDAPSYGAIQVEQGQFATAYEAFSPRIGRINDLLLSGGGAAAAGGAAAGARFLLLGDSITETATWDAGGYTENTRSNWPKFAMPALGASFWRNYAKSGASFFEFSGQIESRRISVQLDRAITDAVAPDMVVVAAGTNDAFINPGTYAAAMAKTTLASLDRTNTAEAIRHAFWKIRTQWPNAKCFAVLPIQRADTETTDRQPLLDMIAQFARRYNFRVIDAHTESDIVKDFEVWNAAGRDLYDGLHPGVSGQQKIAGLVVSKVRAALL
jgi:lysophospholipase L1-like esterase